MTAELTPERKLAAHNGRVRMMWLRAALVGKDGRGLQQATGNPLTTDFYPNQVLTVLAFDRLNAIEKCRQIGESFIFALDSLARAANEPHTTAIHISTDKWESQSKQGYVLRSLDAMNKAARAEIKLVSEAKDHLELETKDGTAHINFLAQRDPRGAERAAVYLHEMAHMEKLSAIIKGSVAATLHGGFVKGCSTHEGSLNTFNAIMTNEADENTGEKPYRNWARGTWPWWLCPAFCWDIDAASRLAPQMDTDERVAKFGTDPLQDMRLSSSLSDFQEECECEVIDSRYSYFPMELLEACMMGHENRYFEKCEVSSSDIGALADVEAEIDSLARAISDRTVRGDWVFAMDIGRNRNPDVIAIGHALDVDPDTIAPNLFITMDDMPYPAKQRVISYIMRRLPIGRGLIDRRGIGNQIAEWAKGEFGQRADGIDFTNDNKAMLTNNLKIRMERRDASGSRRLMLPQWGKLRRQIHAIRKLTTPAGNPVYDSKRAKKTDKNREVDDEKSHNDLYWALAMMNSLFDMPEASYAFTPEVIRRPTQGFGGGFARSGNIWTPGMR